MKSPKKQNPIKSLEEIQKKISPYVRPMRIKNVTTQGLWGKLPNIFIKP